MEIKQEVVKRTAQLVDTSEYKCCQVPPGVMIFPTEDRDEITQYADIFAFLVV